MGGKRHGRNKNFWPHQRLCLFGPIGERAATDSKGAAREPAPASPVMPASSRPARASWLLFSLLPRYASSQACSALTVHGGAFYTSALFIGTPPQRMNVVTDTGSYVFLLDSTFCAGPECEVHTRFDVNESTTSKNPTDTGYTLVSTAYGQGAVKGVAWRDHVGLGELQRDDVDMLLMLQSELQGWTVDDKVRADWPDRCTFVPTALLSCSPPVAPLVANQTRAHSRVLTSVPPSVSLSPLWAVRRHHGPWAPADRDQRRGLRPEVPPISS